MKNISNEQLVQIVKNSFSNKYSYWVLLTNGTILILDEAEAAKQRDLRKWVSELLEELCSCRLTVFAYVEDVETVAETGGWIVTNASGVFTYVHPAEINEEDPSELAISVKGCQKFLEDCNNKELLHIHIPQASQGR